MTDPLTRLRRIAHTLADQWQEPVHIIMSPPRTTESAPTIPYCVLSSVANAAEQAAAVETVQPAGADKPAFVPTNWPVGPVEPVDENEVSKPVQRMGGLRPAPKSEVWYEEVVTVEPEWMG